MRSSGRPILHIGGIFFSFVPALVGYVVFRDRGPLIRQHSIAALNFQLTMLIAGAVGGILSLIFIGFLIIIAVSVVILVFSIIAAIAANKGEYYSYPLAIQFVK